MLTLELITGSGFGTLLGVQHALEPDHLAAVSTLVSEERSSYRAALLGVSWGSGALTALVVTTLPSTAARLTYLALFGLGSTLGMAALSGMLGWPIARMGRRHAVTRGISLLVGCVSAGLGTIKAYPQVVQVLSQQ